MSKTQITGIPETVEQVTKTLTDFYSRSSPYILEMSQQDFEAFARFGAGMFLRNTLCLWWYEGHHYDNWPKQKPELVRYFNDLGIVHPDKMTSILMTCAYRSLHNLPLGIEELIKQY
jgi:hypothetical protein